MSLYQLFPRSVRRQSNLLQQFLDLRSLHHAIAQVGKRAGWLQNTDHRGFYDFFACCEACEWFAGLFGLRTAASAGVRLRFRIEMDIYLDF